VAVVILHVHKYEKKVTRKINSRLYINYQLDALIIIYS